MCQVPLMDADGAVACSIDISEPDKVLMELNGTPYKVAQLIDDIRMAFRTTANATCSYTQLGLLFPFASKPSL